MHGAVPGVGVGVCRELCMKVGVGVCMELCMEVRMCGSGGIQEHVCGDRSTIELADEMVRKWNGAHRVV